MIVTLNPISVRKSNNNPFSMHNAFQKNFTVGSNKHGPYSKPFNKFRRLSWEPYAQTQYGLNYTDHDLIANVITGQQDMQNEGWLYIMWHVYLLPGRLFWLVKDPRVSFQGGCQQMPALLSPELFHGCALS